MTGMLFSTAVAGELTARSTSFGMPARFVRKLESFDTSGLGVVVIVAKSGNATEATGSDLGGGESPELLLVNTGLGTWTGLREGSGLGFWLIDSRSSSLRVKIRSEVTRLPLPFAGFLAGDPVEKDVPLFSEVGNLFPEGSKLIGGA